jgi:hypothetical protein
MITVLFIAQMLGGPDPVGFLQSFSTEDRRRLVSIYEMDYLSTGCSGISGVRASVYDDQRQLTHNRGVLFLSHLATSRHQIVRAIAMLELIHMGTPEAVRALEKIPIRDNELMVLDCCLMDRYELKELRARGKERPLYAVYIQSVTQSAIRESLTTRSVTGSEH